MNKIEISSEETECDICGYDHNLEPHRARAIHREQEKLEKQAFTTNRKRNLKRRERDD